MFHQAISLETRSCRPSSLHALSYSLWIITSAVECMQSISFNARPKPYLLIDAAAALCILARLGSISRWWWWWWGLDSKPVSQRQRCTSVHRGSVESWSGSGWRFLSLSLPFYPCTWMPPPPSLLGLVSIRKRIRHRSNGMAPFCQQHKRKKVKVLLNPLLLIRFQNVFLYPCRTTTLWLSLFSARTWSLQISNDTKKA